MQDWGENKGKHLRKEKEIDKHKRIQEEGEELDKEIYKMKC